MTVETKSQTAPMNQVQDRLLRIREVGDLTRMSVSHIYELVRLGEFPQGTKLSKKFVVWPESQVRGWVQGRINASQEKREVCK